MTPKSPAPGNPWAWRTSFPDYHAETDLLLLERGYHVAHLDVVSMLGAESDGRILHQGAATLGLREKPALEKQRRLRALGWDSKLAIVAEGNKLVGHQLPMAEAEETATFIEKHAAAKAATP